MSNQLHINRKIFADLIDPEENGCQDVANHFLSQPEGYMMRDNYSHHVNYPVSISDDQELLKYINEYANEDADDAIENAITSGKGVHIDGTHYSSEWMNITLRESDDEKVNQG